MPKIPFLAQSSVHLKNDTGCLSVIALHIFEMDACLLVFVFFSFFLEAELITARTKPLTDLTI